MKNVGFLLKVVECSKIFYKKIKKIKNFIVMLHYSVNTLKTIELYTFSG